MQQLKQAINNATTQLNISQSELSRRLGKARNYLAEMKRIGCTTSKQQELIAMINQVIAGEVFKSDDQIIAELSERLDEARDRNAELITGNISLKNESDKYFTENQRLKKIIDDVDEGIKSINALLAEETKRANNLHDMLERRINTANLWKGFYCKKRNQFNLAIGVIVLGIFSFITWCFL